MAPQSTTLARVARWSLFGAVVLMGVALVATVYSTSRGVAEASDTLIAGQSAVFRGAVRRIARDRSGVNTADLEAILEQYLDDGLRYIAVLDETGVVAVEAGEPPADRATLRASPKRFELKRYGPRVRMQLLHGRGRSREAAPEPDALSSTRHVIILEFVPQIADGLRADARRSLTIAAFSGAALLLIAVLLVRWFLRQEVLERQLADRRRLASLGEMSATLAHEIRNPIASLKGNAQLLVKMIAAGSDGGTEGDKTRAKARRVVDEAVRLETLTNDLLEFARTGTIDRGSVDPAAVLREAAARFDRARVTSSAAPSSWSLDGARIRQVLTNLLENALEADADGTVDATVSRAGGDLIYTVRDHGAGIEPARRDDVFEPFYTEKSRGTGLGLAVARRIVRLHGGDVTVENAGDGGAIFTVRIPTA